MGELPSEKEANQKIACRFKDDFIDRIANQLDGLLKDEIEFYSRRINGYDQIDKVIRGFEFKDGKVVNEDELTGEEKEKDAA